MEIMEKWVLNSFVKYVNIYAILLFVQKLYVVRRDLM